MCVVRGDRLRHGPGADGGSGPRVGGCLLVAWAHQPLWRSVGPGAVGCVVAAVAGAQGAGEDGLLFGLEPLPVRGGLGAVGVARQGEVGQGVLQVGEWESGEGGQAPGRVVIEVEFGCWQGAVAGQGDADAVEELGQRQLVGAGETLDV
uniref:Uncharacterized protein n=1 Tax=Streptomyces griseus TaxID=1911 RepID=C7G1S0_STRGR|nr:unknown [Streptomyces griseus]